LAAAERNLAAAVNDVKIGNVFNYAHSAFALALTYQAQNRPSEARETAELVVKYSLDTNNVPLLQMAHAFQAELALRQGKMSEASHWARSFDPEPYHAAHRFYVPQLTLAKILLAEDTAESRQSAADLLARLHDFFTSIHNIRFLIDVLAVQSLVDDAQGDEPAALDILERAVHLAEPGGWIRLFVDLGPRMADLLERLRQGGVAPDYIAQIMAAFPGATKDDGPLRETNGPGSSTVAHWGPSSPVEPLTDRELDVLELLAQRLSNKEIAAHLVISPLTVKKHTVSIYGKLAVKNRRQAVSQAAELGILTHTESATRLV
jgi:LuxR family maltose regulon positive regulatory protein